MDSAKSKFQDVLWTYSLDDLSALRREIGDYTAKAHGFQKPESPEELTQLRSRYAGETTPCCECGEDFPLADNMLDREILCAKCRRTEPC